MTSRHNYHVRPASAPGTYYTIWETYRSKLESNSLQAQHRLTAFPMAWDYTSTKRLVSARRQQRKNDKLTATLHREESKVISQYGKAMFEHTIGSVKHNTACKHHTRENRSGRERPKTSGPTRYGGPIYNKRARLLSNIRTKQMDTEYYPELSLPIIHNTIESYNKQYTVRSIGSGRAVCFIEKGCPLSDNGSDNESLLDESVEAPSIGRLKNETIGSYQHKLVSSHSKIEDESPGCQTGCETPSKSVEEEVTLTNHTEETLQPSNKQASPCNQHIETELKDSPQPANSAK